jgi:serine phosphatase RsbU (regulator of sigma subunit)
MANAGHITPYLRGEELTCENGLPLGLVAAASYVESSFHLGAGERLTLMTDGVVEGRNGTGELFGFERTAQLSRETVTTVANAVKRWGQEDDITVLTVMREATAGA